MTGAQQHLMAATTAVSIIEALQDGGVEPCVGGGWAIDALIGHQTREHSDLDLWVQAVQLDPLIRVLTALGVDRILPWGGDMPWNFVLHDGRTTRVDLHFYEVLPVTRELHYGSVVGGLTFAATSLAGSGLIDGWPVRCDSVEWALQCHTGYPLRPVDLQDVAALTRSFGLPMPANDDRGS